MLFATFALALCYFLQIKVLCRSNANEIREFGFLFLRSLLESSSESSSSFQRNFAFAVYMKLSPEKNEMDPFSFAQFFLKVSLIEICFFGNGIITKNDCLSQLTSPRATSSTKITLHQLSFSTAKRKTCFSTIRYFQRFDKGDCQYLYISREQIDYFYPSNIDL